MKNKIMMTSVSVMALASASAGVAVAEEATAPEGGKYTLTFEGSFGRLDNAPADKWGASGGPGDKFGMFDQFGEQSLSYTGAMSLSRDLGENRDVRLGLVFGGTPSNVEMFSSGFSSGYYSSALTNDLSFGALDVDVGMTRQTSAGTVRLFGGLRGLASQSTSELDADKAGSGGEYLNFDADVASSFVGIGPRIGAGLSSGPKAGGFGFSAEVGAAAIFGQRSDDFLVTVDSSSGGPSGGTYGDSTTSSQTVMNLDGKISIDYYFSEKAKLSLGYQARQFWNVDGFSDNDNPDAQPRLMDGAFIGFTTTF